MINVGYVALRMRRAVTVIEGLGPPHAHDDIRAAPIVDQAPEVQDRHVDAMMTALLVEPDLTDPMLGGT